MSARDRIRSLASVPANLGELLDLIAAAEAETSAWLGRASIHFLRNYTTEFTDPYLKFHMIRDGIEPEISHGGYGTMAQELLDPESPLVGEPPDVIVLSLLVEYLDSRCTETGWVADDCIESVEGLVSQVLERTRSLLVANTVLPPIDVLLSDEPTSEVDAEVSRINSRLRELESASAGRVIVSDFAALYANTGGPAAIDRRLWASTQAPFKQAFLDEYAKDIAWSVRVLKGRARKCLVLDCDNTIWGGVIGEDGVEGIALDDRNALGVHFYEFQEAAIALANQGVMLALCSKNNEEDVWRVLEEHPHCPLDRSHLVAWRINWENKAANLVSLAEELNIGLDSFVFVDDSPQERALISELLPEVSLLAVPDELGDYAGILTRDRLFDTTSRSREDEMRTTMYQSETRRREQQARASDLTEYLGSLETVMRVFEVDDASIARVAQLTQKTNQFNLTTRRYSVADIEAFIAGPDSAVYAMSVEDRFGDMGLTGVFIAVRDGGEARVDTLLLSCRVLGRQLEFAFVDTCLSLLADRWGAVEWHAEYLPTEKNAQVADYWDRVGFDAEPVGDGARRYTLEADTSIPEYSNIISVEIE